MVRKTTMPPARETKSVRGKAPTRTAVQINLPWKKIAPWLAVALRVIVVVAQMATVWITWPLWQRREYPPLLPLVPGPAIDLGWVMLVTAATVLIWPRAGLAAHGLTILVAIGQDQTREQPQIISHALLLLGTIPRPAAQLVGRAHLASLWFFAGLHKLLSPGYYTQVIPGLWQPMLPGASASVVQLAGIVGACFELALGILALWPQGRRIAAIAAMLFHLGVFWTLSPWGLDWNESVWPWNMALAFAGFGLLWNWTTPAVADLRQVARPGQIVAVALALMPLGYYFALVDAYLAHCLYSANTPRALIEVSEGSDISLPDATWEPLHVPLPPTYRTYRAYFRAVGQQGDTLTIEDPRWLAPWWGGRRQEFPFDPPEE
jgi:uncharacterized membrane protein YphA (DoxX/SURF4 family)